MDKLTFIAILAASAPSIVQIIKAYVPEDAIDKKFFPVINFLITAGLAYLIQIVDPEVYTHIEMLVMSLMAHLSGQGTYQNFFKPFTKKKKEGKNETNGGK